MIESQVQMKHIYTVLEYAFTYCKTNFIYFWKLSDKKVRKFQVLDGNIKRLAFLGMKEGLILTKKSQVFQLKVEPEVDVQLV